MSLLSKFKSEGLEKSEDRLGGFQRLSTDLYEAKIKVAYITKSKGGAMGFNVLFDVDGKEYRENTIWFTNKDGDNFSVNDNKKKVPLPGFVLVNDLCRLSVDKELFELEDEEKILKIYDPEEKKEVNKSVPTIPELQGASVLLAIRDVIDDKTQQGDDGKYYPTGEYREYNEIAKVFHLDTRATINELEAAVEAEEKGKPVPAFEFADKWKEKYAGQVYDKRKKTGDAPKSGRPTASKDAPQSERKTSSLFKK